MSENLHCDNQNQHKRSPSTPERRPIKIPTPRLTKSKNSRLVFPTPEYTPDVKQNSKSTATQGQQQQQQQHWNQTGNQLITPHFVAKRSFDILSEDVVRDNVVDNDEDNGTFIRPKRSKLMKTVIDEEREQVHEPNDDDIEKTFIDSNNYNDNDSEASTEVASQIDGEFYKTNTRSEIEHQQTSFKQVMDGCMTPERTKSKHELILDNTDTDTDDDREMLDAEIKRICTPKETKAASLESSSKQSQLQTQLEQPFTTPECKIINNAPQVRRYRSGSFNDYASHHHHQPLENFNPNEELLLINRHGNRQVKKICQLQEPYKRSGNLLGRLTKQIVSEDDSDKTDSVETNDEQAKEGGEENEDALEQRLIQEALRSDNNGLYKDGLHGNYSDDEGYSETEEVVLGDSNNNNDDDEEKEYDVQFVSNYFKRMREKRRLANAFREKSSDKNKNIASQSNIIFNRSDIPASPVEPEELHYNSSEEEEEAYLQRLLNKHKGIKPHLTVAATSTSAVATAGAATTETSTAAIDKDLITLTVPKKEASTSEQLSVTPESAPAQSNKDLRMKRKKLMQSEEDKHDNYLNFGFTLGELSNLRKSKKILVFEDPKGSDESGVEKE